MWNEGEAAADGHQDTIMCLRECVHSPPRPSAISRVAFKRGKITMAWLEWAEEEEEKEEGGRQISGSQFPH